MRGGEERKARRAKWGPGIFYHMCDIQCFCLSCVIHAEDRNTTSRT